MVCTGDWPEAFDTNSTRGTGTPTFQDTNFLGSSTETGSGGPNRRTAIGLCRHYSLADILDGTSNTVVFGEVTRGTSNKVFSNRHSTADHSAEVRTVRETVLTLGNAYTDSSFWMSSTRDPGGHDVTVGCLNPANRTADPKEWDATCTITADRGGVYAFSAMPNYNSFQTMLPPNSPCCGRLARRLTPLSSYHSGGGNVTLYDGSVRFISDTINTASTSITKQLVKNGPSGYGVWGAMGSVNGGEIVTP